MTLSWRDIGRAALQQLEAIPAFGLLFLAPAKKHRLAARDSALIVGFGAIGIWLPLVLHYGLDAHATFDARLENIALRGDIFILVPSLLAPLYLLLGGLRDNTRMRRHQVGLFTFSVLASAIALIFWDRSSSSNSVDVGLVLQIVFSLFVSFLLLYVYYVSADLPTSVLETVKKTSATLTAGVLKRRKREGK